MAVDRTRRVLSFLSQPAKAIERAHAHRRASVIEKRVLESQWFSRDVLREWQFSQVKRLLTHAYQTTVYYRELLDGLGIAVRDIRSLSDLQAIPPLERSTVNERLDDLISSDWRDACVWDRTSGSTGTPMRFVHPRPFPWQGASRRQVRDLVGLTGDERTLSLWAAPIRTGGHRTIDPKGKYAQYSFYELPASGLEELLDFIVEWRPEFVFGYVSVMCIIADAFAARGYVPQGIRVIRTHAEKLYDSQRTKIARCLGAEIFDHYGSREISDYGIECREHKGLHLFDNLRLFEIEPLGDQDPQTGQVLVTDFANVAMPLIRYRNGDVLSVDHTPCPCGRGLARATVHGRSCDMIRLRDGTIIDSTFFEELMDPRRVTCFLLHQRTYDRMDVHIVPTDLFTNSYADHLIRELEARTKMADIRMLLEEELDVEIAGKYRLVRSDVSAQGAQGVTGSGS